MPKIGITISTKKSPHWTKFHLEGNHKLADVLKEFNEILYSGYELDLPHLIRRLPLQLGAEQDPDLQVDVQFDREQIRAYSMKKKWVHSVDINKEYDKPGIQRVYNEEKDEYGFWEYRKDKQIYSSTKETPHLV